jgi:Fe-S cluster assembly protein SufD
MKEVTDFYAKQATISSIPWLAERQKSALQFFQQLGFPTRRDEAWKYTSTDAFLKQRFSITEELYAGSREQVAGRSGVQVAGRSDITNKLNFVNGQYLGQDHSQFQGVIIKPLMQACIDHPDLVEPYLGNILKEEHGFQALNTAMIHHGLFIYVPKGLKLEAPISISHVQTVSNQMVHLRHLIVLDEDSQACVVEDYEGETDTCYWTNTVTEIALAENASLTHYKIQRESQSAYHVGHVVAQQKAHSRFENHLLHFGGQWSRSDLSIDLNASRASCLMNGLYAGADKQHLDQQTCVTHHVPACSSEQNYKGILTGRARAVFNGRVLVEKHAVQTVAKQQNKNLLLSEGSEIDTKPQLDIYADDVICSHGATVGQLDEDALFYLATRGIDLSEARKYLIHAFAIDNLRLIENETLRSWLEELLTAQLKLE